VPHRPIEELLPKADWSVYKLVRMASNRALELSEGKRAMVKGVDADKLTTLAIEEIAQGMVLSKESSERISKEQVSSAQSNSDKE